MTSKQKIAELLSLAGLTINGPNPYDPQVHDERLYDRLIAGGSIAAGESYMDGWWDVACLDECIAKILNVYVDKKFSMSLEILAYFFQAFILNLQSKSRAHQVAVEHYDLGNDLYLSFLDPYNQYTCGYFNDATNLNVAQEQKLDLICRKLGITKSDRVLDIGCGWGGFAKFAAERYGCHVTGISISDEQIKYAKQFTKDLPVEIKKMDYRDLSGTFDKIVIVGMIEHVGYKNYRTLMSVVRRVLKDDGLFLLHTIGGDESLRIGDPWTHKYIFSNGMVPSVAQLGAAFERFFIMEDWHNFSAYYDQTLMAWFKNFDTAWPTLKEKYGERFYRMWKYYLLSFAGSFRARRNQLWQVVLSKNGVPGGYRSVR